MSRQAHPEFSGPLIGGAYGRTGQQQPGYLGVESVRDGSALGITVSYWKDEPSIRSWKNQVDHLVAQHRGKQDWYEHYELRVARVERAYSGPTGR